MTAIAVIANRPLASALATVCRRTLGKDDVELSHLDVDFDASREDAMAQIQAFLSNLDDRKGLLILTGMFGATPDNLTRAATEGHSRKRVVTGVSLPMLMRACNYADREIDDLVTLAVEGGQRGTITDHG